MYEKVYGDKYNDKLNLKDIAKLIRQDIKKHVEMGCLPAGKYSVIMRHWSSISITVKNTEDIDIYTPEYVEDVKNNVAVRDWRKAYTLAAEDTIKTMERIAWAYNYDGSEIQTDYFNVNFYLNVSFDYMYTKQRYGIL
jgi:hypothetical protein